MNEMIETKPQNNLPLFIYNDFKKINLTNFENTTELTNFKNVINLGKFGND